MSSIAKYGKYVHLEKAVQGAWRTTSATTYKDKSLTLAQQDDELKKSSLMSATTTMRIATPTGSVVETAPIGRIMRTTNLRMPFYMTSLTECGEDSDARYITEFGADSRLLIHDRKVFGERVCIAAGQLRPKWMAFFAPCHYFDPDAGHPDYLASDPLEFRDTLPWRLKENKYTWQREWRFIWLPDEEPTNLSPIVIPIGSIADIRRFRTAILKPKSATFRAIDFCHCYDKSFRVGDLLLPKCFEISADRIPASQRLEQLAPRRLDRSPK